MKNPHHEIEQTLSAATASLDAATRDAEEAEARLATATKALDHAEAQYDKDPLDAHATEVLSARSARDLATVRSERAARRLEAAKEAHRQASHALKLAQLEASRLKAAEVERKSRAAVATARATRAAAHPVSHLRIAFEAIVGGEDRTRAPLAASLAGHAIALDALAAIEVELAGHEPARALAIAADQADRAEQDSATEAAVYAARITALRDTRDLLDLAAKIQGFAVDRAVSTLGELGVKMQDNYQLPSLRKVLASSDLSELEAIHGFASPLDHASRGIFSEAFAALWPAVAVDREERARKQREERAAREEKARAEAAETARRADEYRKTQAAERAAFHTPRPSN